MAWGLWNKIKNGFRKVGNFVRKAAKTVNEKIIKPFKPVISTAANAISPKLGKALDVGMGAVETLSDDGWGGVGKKAGSSAVQWAKTRFK